MIAGSKTWLSIAAAVALSAGAVAACGERSAESETPVAEAEVKTDLPEQVVSDQQLQGTADAAATGASTPPPSVTTAGATTGTTTTTTAPAQ
jgi:cytoskeletal protein RodZ